MAASSHQRIESLDSLRGLAALSVLLFHTVVAISWPGDWTEWSTWPFLNLPFNGRSAVALFFVLSGFVLSRPYVLASSTGLRVPAFYAKRVCRIWLPWFAVFIASLLAQNWFCHEPARCDPPVDRSFWASHFTWIGLVKQCVFKADAMGLRLLPQDWTLFVELAGSALIPLLIFIVRRKNYFWWIGGLSIVIFLRGFIFFGQNQGPLLISFVLGVLLARHCDTIVNWFKRLTFKYQFAVLVLGLAAYQANLKVQADPLLEKTLWLVSFIGSAMVLIACLGSQRIDRVLNLRPVLWIGKVSYSVYLIQYFVLFALLPVAFGFLNSLGLTKTFWMFPLGFIFSVTFTLVLAGWLHRCVEKPSIQLSRWLASRISFGETA